MIRIQQTHLFLLLNFLFLFRNQGDNRHVSVYVCFAIFMLLNLEKKQNSLYDPLHTNMALI